MKLPMNRRQFVGSLGALAIPTTSILAESEETVTLEGSRTRISLHGQWARRVDDVLVDYVDVPSSLRPSGSYQLTRTCLLPKLSSHQRAFIHFEAVNYHGRVRVNAVDVGVTLPYIPGEFDITPHVHVGENTISVTITDFGTEPSDDGAEAVWLGLTPDWEASGGIIRDAWLEVRPSTFVENVRCSYRFGTEYETVACRVTTWVSAAAAGKGHCEVALLHGTVEVARVERQIEVARGTSAVECELSCNHPALWSPENPNLYTLRVTVQSEAGTDQWSIRTGFRDVTIRGRQFLLNGAPLVLNGICRHDLWKGQGMTLTRAQMEQDMRGIKALGANFVRLVHYPHDRYIIELADQCGLFVSEERGYSHADITQRPPASADIGAQVLDRLIRRDWNSPSVFAWILANESKVPTEYLRAEKARVRALDLQNRFVSVTANENAVPDEVGMDFYSQNVFAPLGILDYGVSGDKPAVVTAWTGVVPYQVEYALPMAVENLINLTDSGQVAGHCFWTWQDIPQWTRFDATAQDGIAQSGVVSEGREPRPLIRLELTRLFERRHNFGTPYTDLRACGPFMVPLRSAPWPPRARIEQIDLTSLISTHGTEAETFKVWDSQALSILGVNISAPMVNGDVRPIVVKPDAPDVEIPIRKNCAQLHFLGQVQWPSGFPLDETVEGATVATYQIRYRNGKTRDIPLRAGIEVASANTLYGGSRANPIATAAQRVFFYIKNWESEQYQALLFSCPTEPDEIESIRCRSASGKTPLLLFAVLAERV